MNCSAGDIAVVVGLGKYSGHLLEVLYLAPAETFTLPNGQTHDPPREHPAWVVKSLAGGVLTTFTDGASKVVQYGVAWDRVLRPLRGLPEDIDEEAAVHG